MAIDINNLKTQIKSILDTANSASATYDLSTGLSTRVKKVFKINPLLLPIQNTLFPYVSIYTTGKDVEHATIAKNQLSAKRKATINFELVGAVWISQVTDITVDPADEEIEKLMENIEEVIRRSDTLNSTVDWTTVDDITYHSVPIVSEQAHLRAGALSLSATLFY